MAEVKTTQWKAYSPYIRLVVTESSNTGSSVTLNWTLYYHTDGNNLAYATDNRAWSVTIGGSVVGSGTYNINGKNASSGLEMGHGTTTISKTSSAQTISYNAKFAFNLTWGSSDPKYAGTLTTSTGTVSVSKVTTYTITYYGNGTGATNVPSKQTKTYGTNIKLSTTKPTRSGYNFSGWATTASGSVAYQPGATYSSNANLNLYAKWTAVTYTVSYNLQGGSGTFNNQTKTHGTNLTLHSSKPTKSGYEFGGWANKAGSTTALYTAGSTYTANASITLYAIWVVTYVKPRITNVSIARCTSNGTVDDTGTYAKVSFHYQTDKSPTGCTIGGATCDISTTALSGDISKVVGTYSADASHNISIVVTDSGGSTTFTGLLPSMHLYIDCMPNATGGIAFGGVAQTAGKMEVYYDAVFKSGVSVGTKTLATYISDNIPSASTSASGKVQLSDAVNSTSTTLAGTANAVKKAYDRGSTGVTNAATAQSGVNTLNGYFTSGICKLANGGTGASTASGARANLGIGVTQLFSGTFKSGSSATTFSLNYNFFIIVGKASTSNSSYSIAVIPKSFITTSDQAFQIADDASYITFKLKYSGSTVTMSYNNGSGQVNRVYGVI